MTQTTSSVLDLKGFFGRVVVISLKKRPDRLASFRQVIKNCNWPFADPELFEAIDGSIVPTPNGWEQGGGAWGCMQSHRQILERAIIDQVESVLVLEDDLCVTDDFAERIVSFLKDVPDDWDQLMLGGQQMGGSTQVKPGVVRCTNCQRTHAYAIRGRMLRDLYALWHSPAETVKVKCKKCREPHEYVGGGSRVHCDWLMGPMQNKYNVYAPSPFLFGQERSHSDICGRTNPRKFWISPTGKEPAILLKCRNKEVVKQLRDHGVHTGYERHPKSDVDLGLLKAFSSKNVKAALTRWMWDLQSEVVSKNGNILAVWHPEATIEMVRQAWNGPITEVVAETLEDAQRQIPDLEKIQAKKGYLVLLDIESKSDVGHLRRYGFHTGNWRDPVSDQDNGLRAIFDGDNDTEKMLAEWVQVVGTEADAKATIPALWHPAITAEMARKAAGDRELVELSSKEDAIKWKDSL